MTAKKPLPPPATYAVSAAFGDYIVTVAARPDGIVSYASCNQEHVGYFADDPKDDVTECELLRPARDVLMLSLRALMATGLGEKLAR